MTDSTDLLQQQIIYYRARASEYDEWFYRLGRYDHGAEHTRQWFAEAAEVRAALYATAEAITAETKHALEFACGTGIWTGELVKLADHVTALDASPEVIAINRAKLRAMDDPENAEDRVAFVETDIFAWEPAAGEQYDLIFFGFWLSHVPPERLDAFLATVARALKPGGRVFMVDSARSSTGAARGQHVQPEGEIRQRRHLNDGRQFEVVKIYYTPERLAADFARAGITADAQMTDTFFVYAVGKLN